MNYASSLYFQFFNLNMTDSPGEEDGQCNGEGKEALIVLVVSDEANQTWKSRSMK